ncbi:MAG: helix-turn-helix domain-containing protein [Erysipelotrichaceae bacterium]|nr:helix-turn-helix domain-containing protein [Erysipelotrichaceae bacterium]MBQ1788181.1 helix-turn-helix domain-containing protein [Erysipelotrichaceae bacterium]MBQ1810947.1 helix-turn-helix domain-containing protein [Erysipelotrichaceae bacterium]
MKENLLNKLAEISEEEKEILSGKEYVNRELYYSGSKSDVIDSSRVLQNGKLIDIRRHTRFIHFPKHRHNYIEFVYMVKGSTTHFIDGKMITLNQGDLLFMNQNAEQEILPAGKEDIAVNFMILPSFFDDSFNAIYRESNALKDFVISCLTAERSTPNYLFFRAGNIVPVQNLLENLVWNLLEDEPNRRSMNQLTMSLLFLSLINHTEALQIENDSFDQRIALEALRYINDSYASCSLTHFASVKNMDIYTVSRIIKKQTGRTFKKLLEEKRLTQACFLLKNTSMPIENIALTIGYENLSFFYRLFRKEYGMSPRDFRIS